MIERTARLVWVVLCACGAACAGDRGNASPRERDVGGIAVTDGRMPGFTDSGAADANGASDGAGQPPADAAPTSPDGAPAGEHRACQRVCSTAADCCSQPPCDSYPQRYSCPNGYCRNEGCAGDPDCAGMGLELECLTIDGMRTCAEACTGDGDCTFISGDRCVSQTYCESSTPANYPACDPATPCPDVPGITKCYEARGRCGCVDEASCQGMAAEGGTWECAPL